MSYYTTISNCSDDTGEYPALRWGNYSSLNTDVNENGADEEII